ncbi:MAG: MFS transporter [Anaerolineales bacterium]|nr:MFS transporter [Anaerolineales bacterium]
MSVTSTTPLSVVGEQVKKKPLLNSLMLLFLFAMILANIGGQMYGPLLPLYLKDLGAGVAQIGLFFTLSQIIPLALQILGGWISDSVGRLRAIAMGSLAGVLAYVALVLAPTWQWLLLGSAFMAVGGSLVGPSFDAFIAENSTEENRARVFGISQALFMIVAVVGPVLGGYLAQSGGFKVMLTVAASAYFLATLIRIGMARRAAQGHEANPQALSLQGLKANLGAMLGLLVAGGLITWIMITDGVRDIAFSLSMNLLPVYVEEIGGLTLPQIGVMNSIFGLCMMLTTIPAGWLADKKGERVGIATSFIIVGLALFLLIFMPTQNFWLYVSGWALAGVGVGLANPAYQSLISKAVPQKVRGTAFGLFSTSLGLVSLPWPWVGGQLWEHVGPRFPFIITAVVSIISVIPVWLKFKLPAGATDEAQPAESQP